jgi:PAS domain S-box-containing protein
MFSFKTILGFLFMALVLTIAILAMVCFQANRDTLEASRGVDHTHRVIEKVDAISAAYKDMQLSVYRGSGRQRYREAKSSLLARVNDLRDFTRESKQRQLRIDSLQQGIRQWISLSDSVGRVVGADDISRCIKAIHESEEMLLKKRGVASEETSKAFRKILVLLLVCIAVLLISTFLAIRYNFNKRMRMQEELQRSNVLFGKVFYDSPIAIVISEYESGRILNCNSVFADTVNYRVDELIGKTAVELGIVESMEQRREIIRNIGVGPVAKHIETYIRPRDKDLMYSSVHAHVISLYDRNCLLTAILDLSAHKRAEEETRKALEAVIELSKLKSDFVTLASHEFRTPLTTILSSAFLVENYALGKNREKVRKHLVKIRSSVSALTAILDEFMSVTKIDEGNVQLNLEQIDLPAYIENVRGNLQTFAKSGQTIHYTHTGPDAVWTDPVLLGAIVRNLVTNSIKYSPEDTAIDVSTRVNGSIYLTVCDCGIGIPKEDQKHLFDRFFRASNAGNIQGTGLGLHIMRHYVEMLKGTVALQSELGKGTQVDVVLTQPA